MLSKPLLYVFDHQIISLMFRPRGINFLFSKSTDNPLQKLVKCLHYELKLNSVKLLRFKCASNMNMANDLKMLKTLCTNINSLSTSNFSNYEENLKINYKSAGLRINYVPEVSNLSCNYYSNSLIHNDTFQNQAKSIKSVRKLIGELTVDERREILLDLQLEEAAVRKKEAEEKLASWHWRSKFGRPTSVHPSTVDPSGTYCEIPQDWLIKKVAESVKINPPTFSDLRKMAVFNALPFIVFGFLDNFIMIVAGDYIDITIGTYFCISTMAAAALGNTISDLAGIGSAWYVEFLASKIGVRPPDLSQEQQDMSSTRWSANIGRGVGVCVGCLLGMFPLLWLPKHSRSDKAKKLEGESQNKT